MRDLSAHLRHLFVVQTLGEVPDSFSVTAEHTDRLAAQAERLSQGEVLRAIDFLAAAIAAVKDGSEPRIQLELALLKAVQPQADLSLQALMFRIEQLEARSAAAPGQRRRARAAPSPPEPAAPSARPRSRRGGAPRAAPTAEPRPSPPDPEPVGPSSWTRSWPVAGRRRSRRASRTGWSAPRSARPAPASRATG